MPRTKEQFNAMKVARKAKILSAAAVLFAIEGYDSVTVDKIVEKAKCSHGLFYHYFKNKDDIFEELVSKLTLKNFNGYNQKLLLEEPIVALRTIVSNALSQITKDNDSPYLLYIFLTYNLQANTPQIIEGQELRSGFDVVYKIISEGQKIEQVGPGDPKDYLLCLISLLRGLTYTYIVHKEQKLENFLPSVDVIMNLFTRKV